MPNLPDSLKLGALLLSSCQTDRRNSWFLELAGLLPAAKNHENCNGVYTHAHLWFPRSFLAVNHYNNKNWVPCILTHNLWLILWGWSKKNQNQNQNGRLKKTEFFNSANSQYFFVKISWIGPWVSRIDWCEGHQSYSTYMAVRLSNISSKKG